MKQKILITGSSGFVGKKLVALLKKKYDLFLIDKNYTSKNKSKFFKINLLNIEKLDNFFKKNKIDIIIHLASEIFDDDNNVYKFNLNTSKNLISMAERYKIKNFIFTSTFSIYEKNYNKPIKEKERPSAKNLYGKSKYEIEKILEKSNINNFTILRIPVVVGKSRSHRMGILFELIRNNLPLILIDNGKHKIHFISVEELVIIIEKCLKLKKRNLFNVGAKYINTFRENIDHILKKSKSKSKIISINYYLGSFLLNSLIFFKLVDINFYHKALLTQNIVLNTDKANKKFKLKFKKSTKEILFESFNYYNRNLGKINNIKSGSDKKPRLKVLNIFKIFSFLFN
jgi:UDP-glucose 4-epimerase